MDMGRCVVILTLLLQFLFVSGNVQLKVEHKFKGKHKSFTALQTHDARRHGRMLDDVDLPLGGDFYAGLYYTKIGLGNPSNDYYVQVDTGSDLLWVNCAGCDECPSKSDLGVKLTRFDPKRSTTSKMIDCGSDQCSMILSGNSTGCQAGSLCAYLVPYADGSSTTGYIVEDDFQYDKASGNLQTTSGKASVVFGCGAKQGGGLSSSEMALDGIIGFGQANSSVLSQLSAAKQVKKVFSHCLDDNNGGGIFAIGETMETKLNTTPLIPQQQSYTVAMKSVEVVGSATQFSSVANAVIDSGTTLAYVPNELFQKLMNAITSQQPNLKMHTENGKQCFRYTDNVDKGFPAVKFHFKNSLTLSVDPDEYLIQYDDELWCIGWQNSQSLGESWHDTVLLGDLVLADKLVVYDLEEQTIGWIDYNCSSSIKVKGSASGVAYSVGAQNISSSYLSTPCSSLTFFLVLLTILFKINNQ